MDTSTAIRSSLVQHDNSYIYTKSNIEIFKEKGYISEYIPFLNIIGLKLPGRDIYLLPNDVDFTTIFPFECNDNVPVTFKQCVWYIFSGNIEKMKYTDPTTFCICNKCYQHFPEELKTMFVPIFIVKSDSEIKCSTYRLRKNKIDDIKYVKVENIFYIVEYKEDGDWNFADCTIEKMTIFPVFPVKKCEFRITAFSGFYERDYVTYEINSVTNTGKPIKKLFDKNFYRDVSNNSIVIAQMNYNAETNSASAIQFTSKLSLSSEKDEEPTGLKIDLFFATYLKQLSRGPNSIYDFSNSTDYYKCHGRKTDGTPCNNVTFHSLKTYYYCPCCDCILCVDCIKHCKHTTKLLFTDGFSKYLRTYGTCSDICVKGRDDIYTIECGNPYGYGIQPVIDPEQDYKSSCVYPTTLEHDSNENTNNSMISDGHIYKNVKFGLYEFNKVRKFRSFYVQPIFK